jgi:glutathione synthase/RimK-type ligase-like ATP-grasp enzyme
VIIGIHPRTGSFSDRWIDYCKERGIAHRLVNCLDSSIVREAAGLNALLWHWTLNDPRELTCARLIAAAFKETGIVLFPNWETCGHYDDKIAQKYLLEAIGAPLIPTWVFTDRAQAAEWINGATWPKVFKLRCGAGSSNVRLVRSRDEAMNLSRQAFGRGFPAEMVRMDAVQKYMKAGVKTKDIPRRVWRLARKGFLKLFGPEEFPRQKGYLYFQEFMPNNHFDTRVTVIGNRAFAFARENRPGDFRASGSGRLVYDAAKIDPRCVPIAFQVAQRLKTQSLAFDFLFDPQGRPVIGEISYCYMAGAVHDCPGHWDSQMNWHEGKVWPQDAILEDVLAEVEARQGSPAVASK